MANENDVLGPYSLSSTEIRPNLEVHCAKKKIHSAGGAIFWQSRFWEASHHHGFYYNATFRTF